MALRHVLAIGAVVSVLAGGGPAAAATVNEHISFSNFGTYATDGDPTHGYVNTSWAGSFNIKFDPTQLYLAQSITGVISNLTYAITDPFFSGSPLPFNAIKYFAFDGAGTLTLSSDLSLSKSLGNTINITLGINGWAYGQQSGVWYSQDAYGHTLTGSGTVNIQDLPAETNGPLVTPLPGTLPFLATGLAGLSLLARRRRKAAAV